MSAPSSPHVHWFEVDRVLHVIWTRHSEPVAWVAEATDAFLRGLSGMTGITTWRFVDGGRWPSSPTDLEQIVESKVERDDSDEPLPLSGYALDLIGTADAMGVEISISAGDVTIGRNLPLHTVLVRPLPKRGFRPSASFFDDLVDLAIRCWDPILVDVAGAETSKLWGRRGGWSIRPGWRLWLSDEIGPITEVADGATATRLHNGTVLSVPDEWDPQRVVDVIGGTILANGLTEIPH